MILTIRRSKYNIQAKLYKPAVCQGTERMSTPACIYMPLQRKNSDTELYTRIKYVLD